MAFTPKPMRRQDKRDGAYGRRRPVLPHLVERRPGESPLAYAKRTFRAWQGREFYGKGTARRARPMSDN